MKIAFGNDHAGLPLKKSILAYLEKRKIVVQDYGTDCALQCFSAPIAEKVAHDVGSGAADFGILICGTGVGMSIAANKVWGVRCALCGDVFTARMSRAHNDVKVLALGARVLGEGLAVEIVEAWLDAAFEGGRRESSYGLITDIEKRNVNRAGLL